MSTMLQSRTALHAADPEAAVASILEHMREHDLTPIQQQERWTIQLPHGGQASLWCDARRIHAQVDAASLDVLQDISITLAHLILEAAEAPADALRWKGDGYDGAVQRPPALRLLRVLSMRDLTPHMRRVRLGCDDLARYDQNADIHCKLLFPQPGVEQPEWPILAANGMPRFPEGSKRLDVRTYTIGAISAQEGWMDVDFVLHEDAGPGSAWAAQARPGQVIGMSGPGGRTATPADWMLLAGDDTALPAMLRIAAALPPHTRGHVFAEVQGPQDEQPVQAPPGLQWHWLHRGNTAPGCGTLLQDAVRAAPWPQDSAAAGSRFVWVGAEFQTAQTLRQWVREERGLDKHEQLVVAYWRHGLNETEFKSGAASAAARK